MNTTHQHENETIEAKQYNCLCIWELPRWKAPGENGQRLCLNSCPTLFCRVSATQAIDTSHNPYPPIILCMYLLTHDWNSVKECWSHVRAQLLAHFLCRLPSEWWNPTANPLGHTCSQTLTNLCIYYMYVHVLGMLHKRYARYVALLLLGQAHKACTLYAYVPRALFGENTSCFTVNT